MDWISVEAEYISTGTSLRGLAEKHGMSLSTLRDRSVKRGWVAKREEFRNKTAAEVLLETADDKVDTGSKCAEMIREAFGNLCKALLRMSKNLAAEESPSTRDVLIIARAMTSMLDNNDTLFGGSESKQIIIEVGPKLRELSM